MTNKQRRYIIFKNFKLQYNIHLEPAMLDDIDEIFHNYIKAGMERLGWYRSINALLGIFAFVVWIFIPDDQMKWFFFGFLMLFIIYNIWHALVNYVEVKSLKEPKRISDE